MRKIAYILMAFFMAPTMAAAFSDEAGDRQVSVETIIESPVGGEGAYDPDETMHQTIIIRDRPVAVDAMSGAPVRPVGEKEEKPQSLRDAVRSKMR